MKIVKDKLKLSKTIAETKFTPADIESISTILASGLVKFGGIGLSANQLGLDVRACIINVKDPLVLINPKIVDYSQDSLA